MIYIDRDLIRILQQLDRTIPKDPTDHGGPLQGDSLLRQQSIEMSLE